MTNENNEMKKMTLVTFLKRMKKHRKLYGWVMLAVMVISAIWIYSVPRTYTAQTALAPEAEQQSATLGGLNMMASQLGLDLSNVQTTDAISPTLYPELMNDNKFVVELLKIQLHTSESPVQRSYYTYLTRERKQSWMADIKDALVAKFSKSERPQNPFKNPYMLNKDNERIVEQIRDDIKISVDRQTGVINVFATAQDPVVCKLLADSCTEHLKVFIVKYRTSKAQKDVAHYRQLMHDAQLQYERVRRKYAASADANQDVILESVRSKVEDMENDMQLKYNQYTAMSTQYEAAIAKVREQTPVFTVLQGACVPVKPSSPKRVLTILGMMLFALFALTACLVARDLLKEI